MEAQTASRGLEIGAMVCKRKKGAYRKWGNMPITSSPTAALYIEALGKCGAEGGRVALVGVLAQLVRAGLHADAYLGAPELGVQVERFVPRLRPSRQGVAAHIASEVDLVENVTWVGFAAVAELD